MVEPMRLSIDGEATYAFHTGNPPPIDGPLVDVVSHPPVPPLEVDHHRRPAVLAKVDVDEILHAYLDP
jgi:hypothetical protein